MLNSLRVMMLMSACGLLAACPSTNVRSPPSATNDVPEIGAPDLRGATLYTVNPASSDVQVLVFRGGTLARLGHNHVISAKQVTGTVWTHSAVAQSGFELDFPVADLVVDDPSARKAAGDEFPGEISQADRDGTRKNMLGAEVLDGQNHPKITLRSVRLTGSASAAQITTRVTIKGVARDVLVPAAITASGDQLIVTGSFDIQQTQFGIKPFSIGLGALEVQDRLQIVFKLVAEKK